MIPRLYNGRNRTFFFVDYQGERQVQGLTYDETVPTAAEQKSGFTNLQDLITLQTGTTSDSLGRTFPKGTVMDPTTTRAITKGTIDPVTGLSPTATGYVRDPFYTGSPQRDDELYKCGRTTESDSRVKNGSSRGDRSEPLSLTDRFRTQWGISSIARTTP